MWFMASHAEYDASAQRVSDVGQLGMEKKARGFDESGKWGVWNDI